MIYNPKSFALSPAAGFDGIFDWDFLNGCFDRGIQPMDIDGLVENGGHFLAFETKKPGNNIPTGQRIALERLVETGFFTVFYLVGKTAPEIEHFEIWWRKPGLGSVVRTVKEPTSEIIRRYANKWFQKHQGVTY